MLARIILPRCARLSSSLITTLNSSFLLYRIIYHATWSVRDIPLQTVAEWLKIVVTMESRLKTYQCRVCVTQFKLVINLCEAPAVIRHPLDTHTHTHTHLQGALLSPTTHTMLPQASHGFATMWLLFLIST